MADYYFYAFVVLALSLVGAQRLFRKKTYPDGSKPAPGPKPKFFIGNIQEMSGDFLELKLKEWADTFGDIFRLSVFGRPLMILSTEKVANDLLKEKGSIYSSRPIFVSLGELYGEDRFISMLPIDPARPELTQRWRKVRKFMNTMLNPSAVKQYSTTHELESSRLVLDLITDPKLYETACERYGAGLVFRLVYGRPVETGKEDYIQEQLELLHMFEEGIKPGAYLVDTFPILKYLPAIIAPFKRKLLNGRARMRVFYQGLEDTVGQAMAAGAAPPSLTKEYLKGHTGQEIDHLDAQFGLGAIFGAGAGTTGGTLMTFILSMVHHPYWLKRMHNELDEKVGTERLPSFDDLPSLPLVRAVVKEGMRWRPVAPTAIPHELVQDDVHRGTFIPAGSLVIPNLWAIHRDPELYPDGETFNPDRWLSPKFPTYQEPLTKFPNLQNYSVFGFGRRICPGQHLADRSVTLAIARIAWACNIEKDIRPDGTEVPVPLHDFTGGLISKPKPFNFRLTARDENRRRVVEKTVEYWEQNDPLEVDASY